MVRVLPAVSSAVTGRTHKETGTTMHRVVVIATASLALAACAGTSLPTFDISSFQLPKWQAAAPATTVAFESEPEGAEVKTSTGQSCRTPCSLSVPAADFSATFTLNGYQPQTVAVRATPPSTAFDPASEEGGGPPIPTMTPNPVAVELQPAPPPPRKKPAPPPKKRAAAQKPKPPAKPAAAPKPPAQPVAPAPAPAAPWPSPTPPPAQR